VRDSYVSDVLTFTQLMAMKRQSEMEKMVENKNVNHENGQRGKRW
jgi:hypothetical protein